MKKWDYDKHLTDKLIQGFKEGFDFGYRGPKIRQHTSNNIPLQLGTKTDLWNKVMKEVEVGHYAGPFTEIPYDNYMQSPIGLVPKGGANSGQTRLIFHLSYNFGKGESNSFNACTPEDLCKVKYNDLDYAIRCSLAILKDQGADIIYYAKTDIKSVFRLVPGHPSQYCWLILKAEDPVTGHDMYFADKNMLFGTSI